jgi:hypothetical protein
MMECSVVQNLESNETKRTKRFRRKGVREAQRGWIELHLCFDRFQCG